MTPPNDPRLRFIRAAPHPADYDYRQLCSIVAEGLSRPQKHLPCRYFYDSAGSMLFERICDLPEYYLTRTEQSILEASAGEMVESAGADLQIVELGSGSSRKTRLLLRAALDRQPTLHYVPIDISAEFLRESASALLGEHSRLSITAIADEYQPAVAEVPAHSGPTLTLFLGSNIGNFDRAEAVSLLGLLRQRMGREDSLLIGIDLVKDRRLLQAAYNDAAGVTAAFNKNLLARLNRELGGRFVVDCFAHHAPYLEAESRVEMRLVSKRRQSAFIAALDRDYAFEEGEHIHTENSHKYTLASFDAICAEAGLSVDQRWLDERAWFAVLLLRPEPHWYG